MRRYSRGEWPRARRKTVAKYWLDEKPLAHAQADPAGARCGADRLAEPRANASATAASPAPWRASLWRSRARVSQSARPGGRAARPGHAAATTPTLHRAPRRHTKTAEDLAGCRARPVRASAQPDTGKSFLAGCGSSGADLGQGPRPRRARQGHLDRARRTRARRRHRHPGRLRLRRRRRRLGAGAVDPLRPRPRPQRRVRHDRRGRTLADVPAASRRVAGLPAPARGHGCCRGSFRRARPPAGAGRAGGRSGASAAAAEVEARAHRLDAAVPRARRASTRASRGSAAAPARCCGPIDGGRTWQNVSPPGSAGLLFRDVEAESAFKASVLSIGEGDASRIYTTFDGGRNWTTAFVNDDPRAFYDCMDFYAGGKRGLALSDPVDGKFRIAATDDWGRSWHVLPEHRDAARRRRRVRVRRQRHVPRDQRPRRLVRHRRRRRARRSTRATAASPGPPRPRRSRPPRRAACSRSRSATRARA